MYIPLIIIISILSLFTIGDKIGNFLVRNKKYVSGFFYLLTILSFLFLTDTTNHAIHESGEKALDLLWFILFLPILARVFDFSLAKRLMIFRKEMGILMGVLAFVHSLQYFISENAYQFWELGFWFFAGNLTFLAYGFIALIIAIVLTATSNDFLIKKMKKNWKLLHRTVYVLLIFSILHISVLNPGELFGNFGPLFFYGIGKYLEWKNIKLNVNFINKA